MPVFTEAATPVSVPWLGLLGDAIDDPLNSHDSERTGERRPVSLQSTSCHRARPSFRFSNASDDREEAIEANAGMPANRCRISRPTEERLGPSRRRVGLPLVRKDYVGPGTRDGPGRRNRWGAAGREPHCGQAWRGQAGEVGATLGPLSPSSSVDYQGSCFGIRGSRSRNAVSPPGLPFVAPTFL